MKGIAVVIPVYNGAGMLPSCVESVKRAGERIEEIIIVDDGSTDATLAVAEGLSAGDSRIQVIHTDNHGCYAARVTGIRNASAPYVASADVDDGYLPGALDRMAELIEEYDADVAMGSYLEVTSLDVRISDVCPENIKISSDEQMWLRIMKWKTQEFVNYVWNKLYKRELFNDLVDADGINQGEDVLITCQAFIGVKRIAETAEPVYLYYQNPESLTRVGFGASDLNLIRVWDNVVDIMKKKRTDLLPMAQFNRWRTDFTLITRLILVDDRETDRKYADELKIWRSSLRVHWKDLVSPHAMPKSRELLVIGLRFFYVPTKILMRLGRKLVKKETSVILHSGDKRYIEMRR